MRLWSLHPSLLDAKGLVALWRESLLAQQVLRGLTQGYRHHPQLARFRACNDPQAAIAAYLHEVFRESQRRGYRFDASKIAARPQRARIPVLRGQLRHERDLLEAKLRSRDRLALAHLKAVKRISAHPLFHIIPGGVAEWERVHKR